MINDARVAAFCQDLAADRGANDRKGFDISQVALAALAVGLAFQGSRGIFETSEGRYALIAQEMLHSGQWLEPTIDGQPYRAKPPLAFWAMATGMAFAGENSWGVRLPAVLIHAATAVLVAAIAGMLAGARIGRAAGFIYATAWLPLLAAHNATADVYLVLFETAAVAAFVAAVAAPECAAKTRWVRLMWLAFALGFLTKGPPALLPLLPIIVWRRSLPVPQRPWLWNVSGGAIFAVVGLGWYVAMVAHEPGLFRYFWGTEVVQRMSGGVGHNSQWWKGPVIYVPSLAFAAGFPGLVALGHVLLARWRNLPRDAVVPAQDWGRARVFLGWWIALPLGVFLMAGSKLPFYVAPLAAPVVILAAMVLAPALTSRSLAMIIIASGIAMTGAKLGAALWPARSDMTALANTVHMTMAANRMPDASIVLATGKPLRGLEFSLRQKLLRPPVWADAAAVEQFIDAVARDCDEGRFPRGMVIISGKRDTPALVRRLADRGHGGTVHEGPFWSLILIESANQAGSS